MVQINSSYLVLAKTVASVLREQFSTDLYQDNNMIHEDKK